MPVKKGLVEENVSTEVLAALSTAFGREISFVDDLTYAEYETELREAMLKVHPDRGGDEETFKILSAERERIKKRNSEIVPKEKKTSISGAKLLPGTTFRPDDIKPADVDKDSSGSSTVNIADRLNNIADALGVIGGLFKLELKALQDKETQDLKDKAEQDKKAREAELEAKKETKKKKKDSGLKLPGMGILGTLKKFFTNVALGAVSLKLMDWLKDPANREKMLKVTDWLTNNAGSIFKGLIVLAGFDIATRVLGIAMAISKVLAWLGLLPLAIGALLFSLGRLGSKRLPKHAREVIEELQSMEGGVTAENRQKLLEKLKLELTEKEAEKQAMTTAAALTFPTGISYAPEILNLGNEIKVLKDMIKFLETGVHSKLPKQKAGALPGQGTDVKINWEDMYAEGGRPPVGKVVSVGEEGRELFVADTSGTIIPNDKTEHVFDGGALLVAKSNTMDKVSGISQRVSKKRTPNLIDLRGGKGSSSNPTFNTGDQISSVSSEDSSNIDIFTGSLSYGLVG